MPQNSGYMIASYVAVAVILGGYVLSLIARARAIARRGAAVNTIARS